MSFTPLPSQGNTSWYGWAGDVHSALTDSTSSAAAALRAGFVAHGDLIANVKDYGAKGDAVTDDTTAINGAIAANPGAVVFFPPGTYKANSTIVVAVDNVHLQLAPGAVIDGRGGATGGTIVKAQGTRTSTSTTLSGSLAVGTRAVTAASATGFSVNDHVILTSTEVWNSDRPTQYLKGELQRITAISGTTVTFDGGLVDTYSTSGQTVTMTRLVMLNGFRMSGGKVLGSGTGGQQFGVYVYAALGSHISNVRVEAAEQVGIFNELTVGHATIGCTVIASNMSGLGYGIKANGGARGTQIVGNHAARCRHGIDTSDTGSNAPPTRDTVISGNTVSSCTSAGISTHGGGENVAITGNTVDNCGGGIVSRCPRVTIVGNTVIGGKGSLETAETYLHGISLIDSNGASPAATDAVVADNNISIAADYSAPDTVYGIRVSAPLLGTRIAGNTLRGFNSHGIYASGHVNTDSVITGNIIDCAQAVAAGAFSMGVFISATSAVSGDSSKRLVVSNNIVRTPPASGVRIDGGFDTTARTTDLAIHGNIVQGPGRAGVELSTGTFGGGILVQGNVFPDATALGTMSTNTDPVYAPPGNFSLAPSVFGNIVGGAAGGFTVQGTLNATAGIPTFGYPATIDPALAAGTMTASTNQARYVRVRDGGTISSIRLRVSVASGNISVAAYQNTGAGLAAAPGTRLATSGAVACPAAGDATISLGSTVTLNPGDWLAVSFDNATAQIVSSPNSSAVSTVGAGRHYQQSTAHPLPTTPAGLTALMATAPLLIGV